MSKTWFITGAGRGFGREFALSALRRGDRVALPRAMQPTSPSSSSSSTIAFCRWSSMSPIAKRASPRSRRP